ncbi:MBL fold metallo-hydrolase [Albidovulum sediminicola]|uniref:MBL fold metallo-hydrolase n=1 Tax=Albidovulum sediminicola TaxID=2984331 RepID=A0ABT2Z1M9_9RHOB|nr:MBL fold metallo-hydrolase [Defluviimonas sp. WL0075]MCV2865037.1 MBL fold metallo-hydrolase [Defluviimonas sp. WL0075]
MTVRTGLSRRQALLSAAALPLAAALPGRASAGAEKQGMSVPTFKRFTLGEFEVTTLLAGTRAVENPHDIFGLNVGAEEFAAASDAAFLPSDVVQFFFTPTLVNTGGSLILFDTGLNPEGITTALAAAGHSPDQIDTVVITHMHGDHIGGLMGEGGATFANASFVTGATEHNHWMGAGNETFDAKVRPLNERFSFLDDGGQVAPGVTALAAHGHTPGHMAYRIESGGKALIVIADAANHPVWSLARPDWEVKFDMDKAMAAATRKSLFGMIAADRLPFIGYHMPFPATGFIEAAGEGFRYVPTSYQLMLG